MWVQFPLDVKAILPYYFKLMNMNFELKTQEIANLISNLFSDYINFFQIKLAILKAKMSFNFELNLSFMKLALKVSIG